MARTVLQQGVHVGKAPRELQEHALKVLGELVGAVRRCHVLVRRAVAAVMCLTQVGLGGHLRKQYALQLLLPSICAGLRSGEV